MISSIIGLIGLQGQRFVNHSLLRGDKDNLQYAKVKIISNVPLLK